MIDVITLAIAKGYTNQTAAIGGTLNNIVRQANGNLQFTYTPTGGSPITFNAGIVPAGRSIQGGAINANGELVLTFDDMTTANVGVVKGADGVDGQDGEDGVDGEDGITPHIGVNGNWFIGTTDTGVRAEGISPHIDTTSGNWFIGTVDTGVKARGEDGETPDPADLISTDPANALELGTDGALFVPPASTGNVAVDGVTIDGNGNTTPLRVRISPETDNALEVDSGGGLYVPPSGLSTVITDGVTVDGDGSSNDPIAVNIGGLISDDTDNAITQGSDDGLFVSIVDVMSSRVIIDGGDSTIFGMQKAIFDGGNSTVFG